MLCPVCHGRHMVAIRGVPLPCPECGGAGEIHCCEGLQVQPGGFDAAAAILDPLPPSNPTATNEGHLAR